ncbi:hypothetical protein EN780_37245, partial [Mesorhizobium sp. M4B.F.Ca.ET.089.01.1.1]
MIGAVYDRDYFCDEHIAEVLQNLETNLRLAWVLDRKEIENYLLVPAALDRAIMRVLNSRLEPGAEKQALTAVSAALLEEITRPLKEDVLSQLMGRRHDYLRPSGQDRSRVYKDVLGAFDRLWDSLETRIALVPGKEVLRLFRQRVQDLYGVT